MAKKSSKSTRRSRAKKQETATKKSASKKVAVAAVIAEDTDKPTVRTEKRVPATKASEQASAQRKVGKLAEEPTEAKADNNNQGRQRAEEIVLPTRNRMLLSAFALGVIIIALILGAGIIHQQNASKQADQMVKSGKDSSKADQILQSGGKVCTNGTSQTDTTGSADPQSVGMMLQSNPVNTIQTPQTLGSGSDVNTLQGASCF